MLLSLSMSHCHRQTVSSLQQTHRLLFISVLGASFLPVLPVNQLQRSGMVHRGGLVVVVAVAEDTVLEY